MDLTFRLQEGTFNFRVAAVMVRDGKLLVMQDPESPYWYLPGGRVHLHERAEDALMREMEEELGISPKIVRPLWLVQNFYQEDVNREQYHELGMYVLVDVSGTDLMERGEEFSTREDGQVNTFRWVEFEKLEGMYLYPLFIKRAIFDLPESLQMITEIR